MKIGVVGAGSIGLYYGGKLAHAGYDVRFLLRGGFEEARRAGIRIYSPDGDIHLTDPQIYRTSEEIGPCDLVLVSLKATSNAILPKILPPLVQADTLVLTLQNGLGNEQYISDLIGPEHVLGGLCFVCLNRPSLASVVHIGHGRVSLGEFNRPSAPRTHAIQEALASSGIKAKVVENLMEERWRKLVWNIPFNGLAVAKGGITVDQILAKPALQQECRDLMGETIETANALGFALDTGYADIQIEQTKSMGDYRPSTLIDFLAGSELEIEPIWGEPLRAAQKVGVPTPHLAALYQELQSLNPRSSR